MKVIFIVPAVLISLAIGAHFVRWAQYGLALVCLLMPVLLVWRKNWTWLVVQLFLFTGVVIWINTGIRITIHRISTGEPYVRASIIMGITALLTFLAGVSLRSRTVRNRYAESVSTGYGSAAAFVLVFLIGTILQIRVGDPVPFLAERFFQGAGWIEIFCLSIYAAWLVEKVLRNQTIGTIRSNIWITFSVVFFLQVILGIAGFKQFLMTGSLHLPVPALIIAGPIFRGEGFFMLIILAFALLIVGPSWCSWLCYIGSWESLLTKSVAKSHSLPSNNNIIRIGIFGAVVLFSVFLRLSGANTAIAIVLGALFGLAGVGIMVMVSKKRGIMVHCTTYCPIGLISNVLGKVNPFRIRIGKRCTDCLRCAGACRYGALDTQTIKNRKPGITCTLCGDCTSVCHESQINYYFPGLTNGTARVVFLVLVVVLHTVFLGVGRI